MIMRQASVYLWKEIFKLNEAFDLGDDYLEDISLIQRSGTSLQSIGSVIDLEVYKNIQAAGCLHGRYDGNDVWILRDHFLGGDLSAFQGHHRKMPSRFL